MPRKHLTDKAVKSLKTTLSQEDFFDDSFTRRGITFGIRVTRKGSKEFFVRYRDVNKRYRRLPIGDAKSLPLFKAHEKAAAIASKLDQGMDPAAERDTYKNSLSFEGLCTSYLKLHANLKKDGGEEDKRIIHTDLLPTWAERKACDIQRKDVIALLDTIGTQRNAPVMANRTRALLSSIFNFGVERELVQSSPCYGLKKKFKEKSKDRFLSDSEIKAIWIQFEKESLETRAALQFILLTAQRPGEVMTAKWSDIGNDNSWRLSSEKTKNGRQQIVPLSSGALAILRDLIQDTESEGYIFRTARSPHIKHRTLQNATTRLANDLKIANFTPHDLRRTAATLLRKTGTRTETLRKILNHTTGSVTDIYDHYNEASEKRSALEQLWVHISGITTKQLILKAVA
jgi:integrase